MSVVTAPRAAAPEAAPLSAGEFTWITDFLYRRTGILLRPGKEFLVAGRLAPRLRALNLTGYRAYVGLLSDPANADEIRTAVDLLTTNETYFFRERKHYAFLLELARKEAEPARREAGQGRPLRAWSAASSTGEEAYGLAMVLQDALGGRDFEVLGTDVSSRVLHTARRGLYPIKAAERIPRVYLKRYCLRGTGDYDGKLLVGGELRRKVTFESANLHEGLERFGSFDVILLRNVMIYFDLPTKQRLLQRVEQSLRPGGHLLIGSSETLQGIETDLTGIEPSIYRKPERAG